MEYLVSAEDTMYHRWQLELLIESFKFHQLEDKLTIAIAKNNENKIEKYSKNILNFKRIFTHDNFGRNREYLPVNKICAILLALNNKLINGPITIIDPDMVLFKPISHPKENINFQLNPLFSLDSVKEYGIKEIIKEIFESKKIGGKLPEWIPLGSVMTFNNVPIEFFQRVLEWIDKLEHDRKKAKKNQCWAIEKVAWILSLMEFYGTLSYKSTYDYEMALIESNRQCNFIHYTHGLPPIFDKRMYKMQPPDYFSMGDVFQVLLENNPSTNSDYLQKLIINYTKDENAPKLNLKELKVNEIMVTKKSLRPQK